MARRRPPPPLVADSADEVEALFYEALAAGDVPRLMALWADDDEVVCVHPNGSRCIGPAAVRDSFESMLGGGGMAILPEQVHRLHTADSAVHHLVEKLEDEGVEVWVMALNVYVRTPAGWRMVAHHATPMQARMVASEGDAPSTLH